MRPTYATELAGLGAQTLGVIAYGAPLSNIARGDCPRAYVDMRPLGRPALYEIWQADEPVTYGSDQDVAFARTRHILFGTLTADIVAEGRFAGLTQQAYLQILSSIETMGFPHLLRVWNYFPRITRQDNNIERYHAFSVGRHEAFIGHARRIEHAPAACALGTQGGPLTIFFLAAKNEGHPIENPRQVSAYKYPPQYGPKSPSFSRAMLSSASGRPVLLISGTASIVGHESRHAGDIAAQLAETLANIDALQRQAHKEGLPAGGTYWLKAYVRDRALAPLVETTVRRWLGRGGELVCLEADICREELLVEIEGYYT